MRSVGRPLYKDVDMVIPIWFSQQTPSEQVKQLLYQTMERWDDYVRSDGVVLVLDGCHWWEPAIKQVREQLSGQGWTILINEENQGKGAAVLKGLKTLLERSSARWFVIRDCDNDHRLIDLPRLVERGTAMEKATGNDRILVLGRRSDLSFPMSFARAQWEFLLDDLIMAGTEWFFAKKDDYPDWSFCSFHDRSPVDFLSGYKLLTRRAAETVVADTSLYEDRYQDLKVLRYCWETAVSLAVLLAGGLVGEVQRLTYRRQPITSYGDRVNPDLYGQQILYTLRRIDAVGLPAKKLLDNACRRSLLWTQDPFRQELISVRETVLKDRGAPTNIVTLDPWFF
ncbi:MAG: hypothetical protein NZ959_09835 [Armatimonadetes bacterium]|nr:hypothetical protein [Armatimonadota bacterium]MDW8122648.1 hypothetical protein [Armatimonadota bacterium]